MLVKHFKIEIDPVAVKRYLGVVRLDQVMPESSERAVHRMIEEAYSLIETAGIYRIDDVVEWEFARVKLSSGLEITSRSVAKLFEHTQMAATLVVTIGGEIEKVVSNLMKS